jgi:muconolactone D-isomerase
MEFLVQITTKLPPDMPAGERDRLIAAERRRGRELMDEGAIQAIWRIPGGLRNVGIWEAADATELHELITSLPASPWFSADVTPLAAHPLSRPDEPPSDPPQRASDSDKRGH